MKKFFVVAMMGLMVLSAGSAFAQRTTDDSRQRELYRQAMDLYGKQKYAAAQQIFDEIALGTKDRADLTTADACYFAGVCSEKLDNNDASYRLEEFLRLYPQSSRCNMARFYLGNFWYTRGSYDVALIYYKQVDPQEVEYNHRSEYNFKMGYCYFHNGDTKKASGYFAQQVGGQSKYRNSSLYYYAHIQYMNGQYELALKNFKELEQDRKFAKIAPSYIARIYYYLGREDELLEMAPRLLNDRDAFRKNEVHQMVGEIYFNRGEYQKALEQYKAVDEAAKREQTQRLATATTRPATTARPPNTCSARPPATTAWLRTPSTSSATATSRPAARKRPAASSSRRPRWTSAPTSRRTPSSTTPSSAANSTRTPTTRASARSRIT